MKKSPPRPNSNQPTRVMTTIPDRSGTGGVTGLWRNLEGHMEGDGVSLSYLEIGSKSGGLVHPVTDQLRFRAELRRLSPDLVNVNPSLDLKSFIRDGLFLWQCARAGIPTVVFFHGWNKQFETQLGRRWRWFFKATYGRANGFIVLASDFKRKLEEWGISRPIIVETTAVDDGLLAGFDVETNLQNMAKNGEARLLFLARIHRAKGIFELLEAVAVLIERGVSVRLAVAGDGPDFSEAQERAEHLGVGDKVEFLGYVRDESKRKAFESAEIYILPSSHGEGMPVSILEAFSFGLPVITTAVGGLPDFFQDGIMGRITESRDPNVIASLIENLVCDHGCRMEMAKHNYHYARDNFYASKVAGRLRRIYHEILSAASGQFNLRGK